MVCGVLAERQTSITCEISKGLWRNARPLTKLWIVYGTLAQCQASLLGAMPGAFPAQCQTLLSGAVVCGGSGGMPGLVKLSIVYGVLARCQASLLGAMLRGGSGAMPDLQPISGLFIGALAECQASSSCGFSMGPWRNARLQFRCCRKGLVLGRPTFRILSPIASGSFRPSAVRTFLSEALRLCPVAPPSLCAVFMASSLWRRCQAAVSIRSFRCGSGLWPVCTKEERRHWTSVVLCRLCSV